MCQRGARPWYHGCRWLVWKPGAHSMLKAVEMLNSFSCFKWYPRTQPHCIPGRLVCHGMAVVGSWNPKNMERGKESAKERR